MRVLKRFTPRPGLGQASTRLGFLLVPIRFASEASSWLSLFKLIWLVLGGGRAVHCTLRPVMP